MVKPPRPHIPERVRAYLLICVGCVLGGLAYPLFLTPNNIAPGGLTGVATILNYLFGLPVGVTSMVLNLPLFLIGYRQMGRVFVLRSLIATLLFSACIDLLAFPVLTEDILLGSVYGGILLGIGLGLIMRGGATTGGSDMIARMVNRRFSFVTVGGFLFIVDCMVIVAAWFTMSANYALYSLICIFVSARMVDVVLAGMGTDRACFVISDKSQDISKRVMQELERGVTLLRAIGAYSGKEKYVMLSIVDRTQVAPLKKIVHDEDERAFVVITQTHETLGEGFRGLLDE